MIHKWDNKIVLEIIEIMIKIIGKIMIKKLIILMETILEIE